MADSAQEVPVRKEVVGRDQEGGLLLTSQCNVCTAPAAELRHYGAVSCYYCRLEIHLSKMCVEHRSQIKNSS